MVKEGQDSSWGGPREGMATKAELPTYHRGNHRYGICDGSNWPNFGLVLEPTKRTLYSLILSARYTLYSQYRQVLSTITGPESYVKGAFLVVTLFPHGRHTIFQAIEYLRCHAAAGTL